MEACTHARVCVSKCVCASTAANDEYVSATSSDSLCLWAAAEQGRGPTDRIHNRDTHRLFPDNVNSSRVKSFVTGAKSL